MALFAGITGLISVLVGWLITIRLFKLARVTRAVPERLLALGFGGLFCVGYPMAGASRAPGLVTTHEGALLFTIGAIGMVVGIAAIGRFPGVVFRPGLTWAKWTSSAITVIGASGGIGCASVVAFANTREEMIRSIQPWALALVAAVCAAFLWNATESLLYYRTMKRRQGLGLANAETTHRFLLWSLASGLSVTAALATLIIRGSGAPIMAPLPMAIISCTTFGASLCWWLAFFMPDRYRRVVVGSDPPGESSAG